MGDTRMAALAVLVAASVACGACGGGDDSGEAAEAPAGDAAQQVRAALADVQTGAEEGDGELFCGRLTRAAQNEYLRMVARTTSAKSCEEAVATVAEANRKDPVAQNPPRIISVRVDGDEATAMATNGGRPPTPMAFVKQDGVWKLVSYSAGTPVF